MNPTPAKVSRRSLNAECVMDCRRSSEAELWIQFSLVFLKYVFSGMFFCLKQYHYVWLKV